MTLAGAVVLTTACTLGPSWEKPQMEVPAVFRGAGVGDGNMADLPWQAVMKDHNLQALLTDVFNNNRDLVSLQHNVEVARQYVTVARAPIFPWFGYSASTSKGMNSAGGANITNTGSVTTNPGSAALSASWEIDIWGKTRREVEGAEASAQEAQEQLNNLRISLMRQVATGYLQLLMLDEQLRIGDFLKELRSREIEVRDTQREPDVESENGVRAYVSTLKLQKRRKHAELLDDLRSIPGVVYLEEL